MVLMIRFGKGCLTFVNNSLLRKLFPLLKLKIDLAIFSSFWKYNVDAKVLKITFHRFY